MTNYYVAKTGDNGNEGSESKPWLTIQKAANTLIAGDIVYIKSGIYKERVIPQESGVSEKKITYSRYSNDIVVIDGESKSINFNHGVFDIQGKNYIDVFGLCIKNSGWGGIQICNSDRVNVNKCYTYNTDASGIQAYSSSNIVVDNNEVENACNAHVTGYDPAGQEAISVANVATFTICNNIVHHIPKKEGIDAKGSCSHGKIYRNYVHDVKAVGIYVDAYASDAHDIAVFQNKVHDAGNGIEMTAEKQGTLRDVNIYNNISYNNIYYCLVVGNIKTASIINNTFFANSAYSALRVRAPIDYIENVTIRNNIFSGSTPASIQYPNPGLHLDHNLFSRSPGYGSDIVIGDPKVLNPSVGDFHLRPDSPAIDAGSSVIAPYVDFDANIRPQGDGYDIGAFEFVGVIPTGTIAGIVIDKDTGLPISGVKVTADGYEDITE